MRFAVLVRNNGIFASIILIHVSLLYCSDARIHKMSSKFCQLFGFLRYIDKKKQKQGNLHIFFEDETPKC